MHYWRFRKYGDPNKVVVRQKPRGEGLEFLKTAVASQTDECIVWPYSNVRGRYGVIQHQGKHHYTHRLALIMFAGKPPTPHHHAAHDPVCCSSPLCVNPRHLRWATKFENERDKFITNSTPRGPKHGNSKLSESDVRAIRSAPGTLQEIASQFGIHKTTVSQIRLRKRWAWLE